MLALKMTGRCRSGGEGDKGALYHSVPPGTGWQRALCGAKPGDRGNGWSEHPGDRVTCPRCLPKMTRPYADAAA